MLKEDKSGWITWKAYQVITDSLTVWEKLMGPPRHKTTERRFYWFACKSFPSLSLSDSYEEARTLAEKYCGNLWTEGTFATLLQRQMTEPAAVSRWDEKKWWWFRFRFYCEDEEFSAVQVKALLLQRERRRHRQVEWAVAQLEGTQQAQQREAIPDDVKLLVWQRDGGKCVRCGRQESLEFDHIIPYSKGGSNTVRNLQLLCETCNRSKGGDLI
jgi:5-methylcytosine-specific restriction endonuclease McrA